MQSHENILNPILRFLVIFLSVILIPRPGLHAETIRKPAFAGSFYPDETQKLTTLIQDLTRDAARTELLLPADRPLKALIIPHAGYLFSGLTAAHASRVLSPGQFKKVVLMGPDHRVGFRGCAVSGGDAYDTPLGIIPLHPDAACLREQSEIFRAILLSDKNEHSLEVVLPFLKYYLKNFSLVPIVMGPGNIGQYIDAIDKIIDPVTLVVASSDLSHFLSFTEAVEKDRATIDLILRLDDEALSKTPDRACGIIPLRVLIQLARRHNWQPVLLHACNSGDTTGNRQRVVGYAAIAFFGNYGETAMPDQKTTPAQLIGEKEGNALLNVARAAIAEKLGSPDDTSGDAPASIADDILNMRRGTFVTLKIDHQLRGCIGNLSPDRKLIDSIKENAISAAFRDPRFRPLSREELDRVDIEISLLTEPQPLAYTDGKDLIAKLRPHNDGVILRKGPYSSTFLPQVWEQLPDAEMFLDHLCLKAGLPAKAWRQPGLEVMTYQVQYFEEKR
jgi:MEMO1 family protein